MDFIGIATLVSVIGSAVAVLLVHRLVGFRPDSRDGALSEWEAGRVRFDTEDDLADQVKQLQRLTRRLCEQIVERELSDEARWRMLDESQDEVRELRAKVLELRVDLMKRLHDSDESRRQRDRELERRQGRELERYRERELLESGRSGQEDRPLAAAR
jgi:hypothetical protein